LKGWQVSGTVFVRSGLPFTPVDLGTSSALNGFVTAARCRDAAGAKYKPKVHGHNFRGPTCIAFGALYNVAEWFGTLGRIRCAGRTNFNADFSIMKYIQVPKWEKAKFGIGAQFYNVFNHPNYDLPIANVANTGNFGQIVRTVSGPTSPFRFGVGRMLRRG